MMPVFLGWLVVQLFALAVLPLTWRLFAVAEPRLSPGEGAGGSADRVCPLAGRDSQCCRTAPGARSWRC